ncbi:hypothetical protein EVAR_76779_1 [Eumeta japonica]|uniref:Uncharacterized protein n=1 Tax=Eumeta variegata TaxID=151549 RepID=A0A4C1STT8_EUMVA|nr:hypothetical protein EVAR_76779_1 [Eumeta japonica]
MTDEIVDKFNDTFKFKWCEYKDSQDIDEPELVMLSNFLNKIADQCSASMPIEKRGNRNSRPEPERRPRRTNAINIVEAVTCKLRVEKSPISYVKADIRGYSTKNRPRERVVKCAQTTAIVTEHAATSVNNVNMMHEGSTVNLIDEQVGNRIGAKGRRETPHTSGVHRHCHRVNEIMR